jgi:predicted dehydrogenase
MRVLVIGAGMYVTGRGNTGPGTVLSSLAEASKMLNIEEVVVASKSPQSAIAVKEATDRINKTIGSNLKVRHRRIAGDPEKEIKTLCGETQFDCAVVSVPDHIHFPFTHELLQGGVHCLVVKPLTPTLAEARELVALQQEQRLYGAVEFHKRFDESNLYIKRAISENRLGKLLYFTVDYSQRIDIPTATFKEWSEKTNIFQYLGVHYVDLIYFLTGFLPIKATAVGTTGILKQKGIDTFDSVHATILWKNPENEADWFASQFSTNWIDPVTTSALSDQKYKVIGTTGRIECDQKNRGIEVVQEMNGIQQINPYFSEYLPDENGKLKFGGYGYKSISRFVLDVADIQNNKTTIDHLEQNRPTFKQSLVSTAVVDAINQSLKDNFSWREIRAEF